MKRRWFLLVLLCTLANCTLNKDKQIERVLQKVAEKMKDVERVEYRVQRIDTLMHGVTRDKSGYALIEKKTEDKIFGFSFFAIRSDIDKEFLYDSNFGYTITPRSKTYTKQRSPYGFLGRPGGQMIISGIFKLDSVYKNIDLTKTKKEYILRYEFEDDTLRGIQNKVKTVILDATSFLPKTIIDSYNMRGSKENHTLYLSDLRINKETSSSILQLKEKLEQYNLVGAEADTINKPH